MLHRVFSNANYNNEKAKHTQNVINNTEWGRFQIIPIKSCLANKLTIWKEV